MIAKFDWLAEAHTEAIREQVIEVFETHDVETIAPQFGRIIRGREVVARHRDLILDALEEVGV
jgi:flavorubredoxin